MSSLRSSMVGGAYRPVRHPCPVAERVLTERGLNRALLARQHLLEPSTAPIASVVERMAGLQSQYAPSMYFGLAARMKSFRRQDLDAALERRSVVQGSMLRNTIHLVSGRDYWSFQVIGHDEQRRSWLAQRDATLTAAEHAAAARRLQTAMRGRTMHRKEIDALLGRDGARNVGLWLPLLRVPPSGTWSHRSADLYAFAEEWVGPCTTTEDDAVAHVARRYLAGFGPSSRQEIATFLGVRLAKVDAALATMAVRHFVAEDGTPLVDLPRAPLPDPDAPAPVRLLPTWDASLLVHKRRTQLLPEEHRAKIFTSSAPQSSATFLVDGQVAGTWRLDGDAVELTPFAPLPAAVRRELADEAERLLGALR